MIYAKEAKILSESIAPKLISDVLSAIDGIIRFCCEKGKDRAYWSTSVLDIKYVNEIASQLTKLGYNVSVIQNKDYISMDIFLVNYETN